MKILILLTVLISMLMGGCTTEKEIPDEVYEISGMKVYINDVQQDCKLYQSSEPYRMANMIEDHPSMYFIPIQTVAEGLGYKYELLENGRIHVSMNDGKYVLIESRDGYFFYDEGEGELINGEIPINEDSIIKRDMRNIDNVLYARISDMNYMFNYKATYDADCIYIDSEDYYYQSVSMHGTEIGRPRNDTVLINNQPFDISIYTNPIYPFETEGLNYVNATELAKALNADIKIKDNNIVEITAPDGTVFEMDVRGVYDSETDTLNANDTGMVYIIDDVVYTAITAVCGRANAYVEYYNRVGDVKDGATVKVYTYDFVREDIPATLEELYPYLDTVFSPVMIESIKRNKPEEVAFLAEQEWRALYAWKKHLRKTPDARFLKEVPETGNFLTGEITYILKGYKEYLLAK